MVFLVHYEHTFFIASGKKICLKTGLSCKDQAISFEKKKKWLLNLHIAPPPGFL